MAAGNSSDLYWFWRSWLWSLEGF